MKKLLAFFISGLMLFSVAACGNEQGNGETAEVSKVAESLIKVSEAESMASDMVMNYSMSMGEEKLDMVMSTYMEMLNNPTKIKMDMTTELLGEGFTTKYYMEETEDGKYTMYYGSEDMAIGWAKEVVDASYVEQLVGNSDYYLEYAKNFESAGTEDLNGEKTERFDGVIKVDDIEEVLSQTGLDAMAGVDSSEFDLAELFANMEDIPLSIWISDESGYPVKYEMDMTKMMQTIMDNVIAMEESQEAMDMNISIDNAFVEITYSNFNGVEDFEIPADVIENAVDMSALAE